MAKFSLVQLIHWHCGKLQSEVLIYLSRPLHRPIIGSSLLDTKQLYLQSQVKFSSYYANPVKSSLPYRFIQYLKASSLYDAISCSQECFMMQVNLIKTRSIRIMQANPVRSKLECWPNDYCLQVHIHINPATVSQFYMDIFTSLQYPIEFCWWTNLCVSIFHL
jgi:hypothetical protein